MAAVAFAAVLVLCPPLLPSSLASTDGIPTARAASPEPSGAGDTRSAGEAPGFVGAPLLAVGGVLQPGDEAVRRTVAHPGPGRAAACGRSRRRSTWPRVGVWVTGRVGARGGRQCADGG